MWNIMWNHVLVIFLWTFMYQVLCFASNFQKIPRFWLKLPVTWKLSSNCDWSYEHGHGKTIKTWFSIIFHSLLIDCAFQILPHSKHEKIRKKVSVFRKNNSCRWPNSLQTHIIWNLIIFPQAAIHGFKISVPVLILFVFQQLLLRNEKFSSYSLFWNEQT